MTHARPLLHTLVVVLLAAPLLAGCVDDTPAPEEPLPPAPMPVESQIPYEARGHPGWGFCPGAACITFAAGRTPRSVQLDGNDSLVALDLHVEWATLDPGTDVDFSIECRAADSGRGCGRLFEHHGPPPFDVHLEDLDTGNGVRIDLFLDHEALLMPVEAAANTLGMYEYHIQGALTVRTTAGNETLESSAALAGS